jgi:hypothetical protein
MTEKTCSSRHPADAVAVAPADVRLVVAAVIQRAAEDVELACSFLEHAGMLGPERQRLKDPVSVPLGLMLKAAGLMRALQWQKALPDGTGNQLADPQALLDNLPKVGHEQHLDGDQVARESFGRWFGTMSWFRLRRGADVLIKNVQPQPVADELANLLWQFRHLLDKPESGEGVA